MATMNKVFLLGNLTRDPDLRYTPSGSAVCEMGLAVSRRFMANNQEQEEVCFVDIVVWGKPAESCKQYLAKGSPALVEGRLQFDQWEDRNGGGKRSRLRVVADRVQFVGPKRSGAEGVEGYPQNDGSYNGNYNQGSQGGAPSYGGGNQTGGNYSRPAPQQQQQSGGYNRPAMPPQPPAIPQVPVMPESAFNPSDELEDDIPF